jgi:trigger factor
LKVEYNEETAVRKSLAFEIEPEVVEREIEDRAKHYAKSVKIPGFRPGKIPVDVIKQRFRGQVMEDVVEKLVNKVVFDEIEGRGLRPLTTPKVEDLKIAENQPLTFRAVFETLPFIEVPEWRGLEVTTRGAQVAEEEVDREVERLREGAARYDPVEGRPLRDGDHAAVDVDYTRDDGTKKHDENVLVEVGSDANHADLNAALVGMSPGEKKTVKIAYGPDAVEGLAGRSVEYALELKAVKTRVVPAADDEFAKDLGEFGSLAELRDRIRTQMLAAEERRIDRELKEKLVEALIAKANFEVPEALVERHMLARTRGAAENLAMQGVDPRKANIDWKQFHEGQREAAVRGAKADILLDEIARREGISIGDAEVEAEITRLAERMGRPREKVRLAMEKEGEIAALKARLREERTLDLLKAAAKMETE